MTSEGHPYAVFRRALGAGSAQIAMSAAAELEHVGLEDALSLVYLLAGTGDPRYSRAAGRWLARLLIERELDLEDALSAACALVVIGSRSGSGMRRERPLSGFPRPSPRSSTLDRWAPDTGMSSASPVLRTRPP